MTERMRAVVITAHGGIETLAVREVARPTPGGEEVLVRVRAAALNRADLLQRRGLYPAPAGAPADIPGLEFAGEIAALGRNARRWQVGQRVFGISGGGAQAEYVVVPESACAEIPDQLGWDEAAAVPEAFITAHDAMFTQGNLTLGEVVLIHAAGSGVGLAAIQLARVAGARTLGTARTPEKLEQARREFGLDEGILVRDDPHAFVSPVREQTGDVGAQLILDLVGASYFAANLEVLASRGRLLLVGTMGGAQTQLDLRTVLAKRLRLTGTVLRTRSTEEKARAVRLFAAHVVPLLTAGKLRPAIDSRFALEEVHTAHLRLESNESFGKVVLRLLPDQ